MVVDNRYIYQYKFVEEDDDKTYRNMYTIIMFILISLLFILFLIFISLIFLKIMH